MEPNIILNGLSIEQLRQIIVDIFKEIEGLKQIKQELTGKSYLSRKEVAKTLQVSLPTLRQYVKSGFIQSHRIGRRILFKSNEVELALTQVKMQRFKRREYVA
ncbi:MAG: helix-turn-helix domain-containing protein [Bacteroidota bacterium]